MTWMRLLDRTSTALFLASLILVASAAGVFVRDVGAGYRASQNGPIDAGASVIIRFYAYALPHELAIFSSVRVNTTVESLFSDWRFTSESNGSHLSSFRFGTPGVHQVSVRNLESVDGQLGVTILQQSNVPPDLESVVLDPLALAAGLLLVASTGLHAASRIVRKSMKPIDDHK